MDEKEDDKKINKKLDEPVHYDDYSKISGSFLCCARCSRNYDLYPCTRNWNKVTCPKCKEILQDAKKLVESYEKEQEGNVRWK